MAELVDALVLGTSDFIVGVRVPPSAPAEFLKFYLYIQANQRVKSMEVKLHKKGELGREMTVTVPAGEVAKMVDERLVKIGNQAKIPGFRSGKIPAKVLKQRFGSQVQDEVRQELISETMPKAFDKEKLTPAGQPQVDFGDVDDGKDYVYTIRFDILPEFEAQGYVDAKLTRQVAKASDKQIKAALSKLAESLRSFEKKDGKAEKGDMAVITAKGFDAKSNKALAGAEVTKHPIELGTGGLIAGFEDQIAGHKEGEKFDVNVTFPKDYHNKDLAGVKAKFEVELHEVKKAITPKIDDAFAKQFGSEDLADIKKKIAAQLEKDIAESSSQRLKRDLFDVLEKKNTFPLPDSMVEQEFNSIWSALQQDMQRSQVTFEMLDKSEDEMRVEHRGLAERRVRVGLVLAEIAKKEQVKVEADEISKEIDRIVSQFPKEQSERARAYYSSERGRQEVFGPLFENKVCEWVFGKAKVTEKEVDADEILLEMNA